MEAPRTNLVEFQPMLEELAHRSAWTTDHAYLKRTSFSSTIHFIFTGHQMVFFLVLNLNIVFYFRVQYNFRITTRRITRLVVRSGRGVLVGEELELRGFSEEVLDFYAYFSRKMLGQVE